MKLIMFDIDGTLTRTDAADGDCFVQALQDVFGFTGISDDWSIYPHCTDSGILDALFHERKGRTPTAHEIAEFQSRFVALLEAESAARPFDQIEGAHEMLRQLAATPGFAVALASGAWECSARLKLASAGLDFPQIPGAFADDAHSREDIMRASLTRATRLHVRDSFESVIYVGDGIWDARACRVLGWPCIGIARDPAKAARLVSEGALTVLSGYEPVQPLFDALTL
jgi:phosphoglycolate phosphatase-like HAD superfamily hydrolase